MGDILTRATPDAAHRASVEVTDTDLVEALVSKLGTRLVAYFYHQARQSESPEGVQEEHFRYPGPRPQSKETALVMLADGSEAAVRSARCTSVEEMDDVIKRVFAERLADHQLDDSDLTLREMEVARLSFLETGKLESERASELCWLPLRSVYLKRAGAMGSNQGKRKHNRALPSFAHLRR